MKFYKINEEVRNAILDYLLTRPMHEVEKGVYVLRMLEEIKETPDAENKIQEQLS